MRVTFNFPTGFEYRFDTLSFPVEFAHDWKTDSRTYTARNGVKLILRPLDGEPHGTITVETQNEEQRIPWVQFCRLCRKTLFGAATLLTEYKSKRWFRSLVYDIPKYRENSIRPDLHPTEAMQLDAVRMIRMQGNAIIDLKGKKTYYLSDKEFIEGMKQEAIEYLAKYRELTNFTRPVRKRNKRERTSPTLVKSRKRI